MMYALRPMRRPLMRDPRLLIDWRGGTPFPAGDYTRGSDGLTRSADGVWRPCAPGIPRTSWGTDPVTGLPVVRTLLEAAATNMARYSEPTVAQLSVAGTGVLDSAWPDASFARAIRIPADTGEDERAYVSHGNLSDQEGETCVVSVFIYMEDGEGPPSVGQSTNDPTSDLNIVCQTAIAGTEIVRVEDLGGSMYRVVARRVLTDSTNTGVGAVRYAANRQRPFRVTGYQVEIAAEPTSPIRTTGAAAPRARDTLYFDLPSEISRPGSAFAIYSRYVMLHDPTHGFATSPVAWAISGASGVGPRLYHYQVNTDGRLSLRHDVSPTSTPFRSISLTAPVPAPGDLVETLTLVGTDEDGNLVARLIASVNRGPLAAADLDPLAPAAAWSGQRFYVGSRGAAPGVYEYERLAVWDGIWAGDAERQFARARGEI